MDEPALDASALLATLTRRGVRFVVIGGLAAVLHGAPYQTVDCDITPDVDDANLAQLSAALRDLGARVWTGHGEGVRFEHDARSLRESRIWNLVTDHGLLDIAFEPAGVGGYEDLCGTRWRSTSTASCSPSRHLRT
ncbi:MAG: nucleotidyltransferase domain-containing protein [Candidatus Dormibacteria bacterium]